MMTPYKAIYCRFQVEAVHVRPQSTEAYERVPHRHLFHFRVSVNAADLHDDGELLNPLRIRRLCLEQLSFVGRNFEAMDVRVALLDFDVMQPLEIASWVGQSLFDSLGRGVTVEVSEDGENGAIVTYGVEDKA